MLRDKKIQKYTVAYMQEKLLQWAEESKNKKVVENDEFIVSVKRELGIPKG